MTTNDSQNPKSYWESRYREDHTPWDTGRPDGHLIRLVLGRPVTPRRILELGCGPGNDAVWLAGRGFSVTGVDIADRAITEARKRAETADVQVDFHALDFTTEDVPGGPFEMAYDRGCFHSSTLDSDELRRTFARRVAHHLRPDALWFSIIGSTDGPPRDTGPPRRSAVQVTAAMEPWFEILSLAAAHFDVNKADPPRAWVALFRRRPESDVRE
ncbi:MAG: class I SAM-dependent methyltransferase [Desulfococcaceae bacterium]